MAIGLGLELASDPRWFYSLSAADRIAVMAWDRIRKAAPKVKQTHTKRKAPKLIPQVKMTAEAADFWFGGD